VEPHPGHARAPSRQTAVTVGAPGEAATARPLRLFDTYPRSATFAAAIGISFAAILFVLSDASPSTATVFRCLYALPLLWWLLRREDAAFGPRPWRARRWPFLAGIFFAGDLLLLRKGRDRSRAAGPIFDSTLACLLVALAAGLMVGDFDPMPTLPSHVWLLLLALTAQVGGGVMLAVALPRLPAVTTSLILLVQPVLATIFAIIILSEAPSSAQFVGVLLIIGGVLLGSARSRRSDPAMTAPPGAAAT